MEIEKLRQCVAAKRVLNPLGEFTLNAVHPIGPVPRSSFHRFVELVRDGFPANDNDVAHGVKVVTLVVEFFRPLSPVDSVLGLGAGEEPANNGREDQNHAHHDFIGVHGLAS